MNTKEKIVWRDLGDCFPEDPEEGLDPPWTFDYDSGLRTHAKLTYFCLHDETTQFARFTCGHGCTRIWLEAWDRRDYIDFDDVSFLALVTHLWRFTCDCVREFWATRRRGGKVLNRRSLARARRWAAAFRDDEARNSLRAEWSERVSPVPVIWCEVPGQEPVRPIETYRFVPSTHGDRVQCEAAR